MTSSENVHSINKKVKKMSLSDRKDSGIGPSEDEHATDIRENRESVEKNLRESRRSRSLVVHSSQPSSLGPPSPLALRKKIMSTKSANDQSEEGVKLNQYVLKEDLGHGSFGAVKLVHNEDDQKDYAMKIMSKKKLKRQAGLRRPPKGRKATSFSDPLERVYQEIALLKKLDHPNIIKLVEVLDDRDNDSLYMVFELMKRGEVLKIPTDSPLTEGKAVKYFRDVVLGLEYLHFQKIIHRDIKPSNLLLDDHDRVKISDLGVCQQFTGQDAEITSTVGTPAFMPPEAASGKEDKFRGRPIDVWALGITLFCFVCGNTPFQSTHALELNSMICDDPVIFPVPLTKHLKDLILKLLEKNPERRITIKEIKDHPWTTEGGKVKLPTESQNCRLVIVTEEDIQKSVKTIPKLDTLVLVKSMIRKHSFKNPLLHHGNTRDQETRKYLSAAATTLHMLSNDPKHKKRF